MKRRHVWLALVGTMVIVLAIAAVWINSRLNTPDPFDVEAFLGYRVADEENAAVHIVKAIDMTDMAAVDALHEKVYYGKAADRGAAEEVRGVDTPPASTRPAATQPAVRYRREIAALVKAHAPALAELRRGLAKPKSYFDLGPEPTLKTPVPFLGGARSLCRLLVLEGADRLGRGDPAGALESYLDNIRMARKIEQRGPALAMLVSVAVDAVTTQQIRELLRSDQATPALCRRTIAALGRLGALTQPPSETMKAEYVIVRNTLRKLGGPGRWWAAVFHRPALSGYYRELLKVCDEPYGKLAGTEVYGDPGSMPRVGGNPLVRLQVAPMSGALMACSRRLARGAMTVLLAAVRCHELETGAMPTGAEALVPRYLKELPVDPYSLEPVKLVRVGGKWVVYAIGEDLIDDGGKKDWQSGQANGDYILPVHDQEPPP